MKDFLKAAWLDIRRGKSIELYLILFLAITVLLVDIFGDFFGIAMDSVLPKITLATLALIIYGMIEERRSTKEIKEQLSNHLMGPSAQRFLSEWDEVEFKERLNTANEYCALLTSPYSFVNTHSERLKDLLRRGGVIRFIFQKPDGEIMKLAVKRGQIGEEKLQHRSIQMNLTLRKLREIANETKAASRIQVKLVDYEPTMVMSIKPEFADWAGFYNVDWFSTILYFKTMFHLTKTTR
jgi:hypothetical protein